MVRSPCSHASALKKGPWTPDEDTKLIDYIERNGHENWKALPKLAGLNRCGKSCRLRWINYLRPDVKRGEFSEEEERVIVNLHSALGNKWSRIANHLPGRTDNEIKNFWNTHIRKKLLQMGIDPHTHKPRIDPSHILNLSQLLGVAQSGNIASPWNSFLKLQAEVTQLANIQLVRNLLQMMNPNTLTNIENNNSLLGSQNPSLFRALVNGTTSSNTKEPAPISQDLANPPVTPQANNGFQDISNLWGSCEGGFVPEGLNTNGNTWSSSYGIQTEQNPLPALVSASTSPVTSIVHQTESKGDQSNYSTTGTPTSTIFEAWEKLIDDDNISSYWNDILD